MQAVFVCSQCDTPVRATVNAQTARITCPGCHVEIETPPGAVVDGKISGCLVCPCKELFLRKDFPQRLGVTIVVLGLAASCVAWNFYSVFWTFAILFATAAIDVILFLAVGEVLACYRCGAMYRGVNDLASHEPFNLETHERFRQQAARLKS